MRYPERDRKTRRLIETGIPYQGDRLARAIPFVRRRRHAVDVGAHVGLWATQLAAIFEHVTAFEPHPDSFLSLAANVAGLGNVRAVECGIGAAAGVARLTSIGLAAHVVEDEASQDGYPIEVRTLDDFDFPVPIDFLKIDVEGFEPFVIAGGRDIIRRDRPVIVIEQKHDRYDRDRLAALDKLRAWGGTVEWRMKHDYCVRWRK